MKKFLFLTMVLAMSVLLGACTIIDDTKEYPETVTITQTITHATSSTDTEKTTETVEEVIEEKTAVKLTEGTSVDIHALDQDIQMLYVSSDKLSEPVSWGDRLL